MQEPTPEAHTAGKQAPKLERIR